MSQMCSYWTYEQNVLRKRSYQNIIAGHYHLLVYVHFLTMMLNVFSLGMDEYWTTPEEVQKHTWETWMMQISNHLCIMQNYSKKLYHVTSVT